MGKGPPPQKGHRPTPPSPRGAGLGISEGIGVETCDSCGGTCAVAFGTCADVSQNLAKLSKMPSFRNALTPKLSKNAKNAKFQDAASPKLGKTSKMLSFRMLLGVNGAGSEVFGAGLASAVADKCL